MRKKQSLIGLGVLLVTVLACRTLQKISSRESLFDGSNLAGAVASCKEKIGGPIKAMSLEITAREATLRVLDAKPPKRVNDYFYARGFCSGPRAVSLDLLATGLPRDSDLFSLDEVDFAMTPQVIKAALARTNIEGGKVSKITISRGKDYRPDDFSNRDITAWTIQISGSRESASATANNKGEIIGVDLSGTARAEEQHYFSGKVLNEAARQIKEAFGGQVYLSRLYIWPRGISFQAATSATSDEVHEYLYDFSGVRRNVTDNTTIGEAYGKLRNRDFYFTLDQIDFGAVSQIEDTAFKESGFAHPIIPSMELSRSADFERRVKPVTWRVSVNNEENIMGRSAYVTFDAKGNFLSK